MTPALAAGCLGCQPPGPEPDRAQVAAIAGRIAAGTWLPGAPVVLAGPGRLVARQAQLQAIVRCGLPALLLVAGNMPCGEWAERTGAIVRDIAAGRWQPWLSPPIEVSAAGLPADGYHRLAAVWLSGRACWQRVAWPDAASPRWLLLSPQIAERWLAAPARR